MLVRGGGGGEAFDKWGEYVFLWHLHVTEFCGEMQGKFKVGLARLIILFLICKICTQNKLIV